MSPFLRYKANYDTRKVSGLSWNGPLVRPPGFQLEFSRTEVQYTLHWATYLLSFNFTGYIGCFEDKSSERDLPRVLSVPHLTPDSCRTACQNAGHAYAGVQYGYLCRCGDTYGKYGKVPDEECNALCTGDKAQKCGGFWKSAVFTTGERLKKNWNYVESKI